MKLGNYDKIDELEKCGNNVIYRLSPDGTYEEFYTFDEGDAIYYSIGSKLYYYEGYFYIQIENRIYRINKEGTEAQVIYENVGGYGSYVTFGIRDHYLVLQKQTEYYYLDMDTWDWSQPIEVGRMWHLMNVRCSYDAVRRNQLICFLRMLSTEQRRKNRSVSILKAICYMVVILYIYMIYVSMMKMRRKKYVLQEVCIA